MSLTDIKAKIKWGILPYLTDNVKVTPNSWIHIKDSNGAGNNISYFFDSCSNTYINRAVIAKQSSSSIYIIILSLGIFFDSIKTPSGWIVEIETTEKDILFFRDPTSILPIQDNSLSAPSTFTREKNFS